MWAEPAEPNGDVELLVGGHVGKAAFHAKQKNDPVGEFAPYEPCKIRVGTVATKEQNLPMYYHTNRQNVTAVRGIACIGMDYPD